MTWLLKRAALLVAVACLTWLAVLWHWQSSRRDMSVNDIVVYLGALPLALFVLLVAGRWAVRGAWARSAASTAAATATTATTAAAAAAATASAAPPAGALQLLAAHLACAAGSSVDDLLAAAETGVPRPEPDATLLDGDGLPTLCARIGGLDEAAMQAALLPHLKALGEEQPQWQHASASPEQVRALAALALVLPDAAAALLACYVTAEQGDGAGGHSPAPPALQVVAAWPADWQAFERALAQRWLHAELQALQGQAGGKAQGTWAIDAPAALSGPELWLHAQARLEATPAAPLLLLAAHSDIGADAVERLERQGLLFSSHRSRARVPAEAAVALVLAPAAAPGLAGAAPLALLQRAACGRRDKSIEAEGRLDSACASRLLADALAMAAAAPADVAAIADDADQHSARGAELFGAMLAQLPDLDPVQDQRMAGHLCGHLGACGTLVAIAMAGTLAARLSRPAAALSVGDPHWRLALLARPPAVPDPAPPSTP